MLFNLALLNKWGLEYNVHSMDVWIRMWNYVGSPNNAKHMRIVDVDTVEIDDEAITLELLADKNIFTLIRK